MSHFAKIDEQNIVVTVIVAEQDFIDTLPDQSCWIQTSYNTWAGKHFDPITQLEDDKPPLRKNYAGIGYSYDSVRDAFIPPKPYSDWILNEDTCLWEPPVPYPQDEQMYAWDENTHQWFIPEV